MWCDVSLLAISQSNSKSLEEESNDVEEDFSVFRTEVKDMSDFAENQEVEQVDKKDTQKTYSLKTKLRCYGKTLPFELFQ